VLTGTLIHFDGRTYLSLIFFGTRPKRFPRLWLPRTSYVLRRLRLPAFSDSLPSCRPSSFRCSTRSDSWSSRAPRCTWKSSLSDNSRRRESMAASCALDRDTLPFLPLRLSRGVYAELVKPWWGPGTFDATTLHWRTVFIGAHSSGSAASAARTNRLTSCSATRPQRAGRVAADPVPRHQTRQARGVPPGAEVQQAHALHDFHLHDGRPAACFRTMSSWRRYNADCPVCTAAARQCHFARPVNPRATGSTL
jgi:hypothetical protein